MAYTTVYTHIGLLTSKGLAERGGVATMNGGKGIEK
jgi:hypothetical protein